MSGDQLFDRYATSYNEALSDALTPSGEDRDYFARGRVGWLKRCLEQMRQRPRAILDYGCGDGSTTRMLLAALGGKSAIGVDISERSIEVARERWAGNGISFEKIGDYQPAREIDLVYCNGVFHHIAPGERPTVVAFLREALRPAGLLAIWENCGWNPATRYVMSRCAFDKDAVLLTPPEMRELLRQGGFEILRSDFRFIFPRFLSVLRPLEDIVYRLPLGTQFQVLARAPGCASSEA